MPKKPNQSATSKSTAFQSPKKLGKLGAIKYSKISNFYISLHESKKYQTIYQTKPTLLIKKGKLSPSHKKIVLGGDAAKIKRAIELETGKPMVGFSWVF
jgi:hypothetical protein